MLSLSDNLVIGDVGAAALADPAQPNFLPRIYDGAAPKRPSRRGLRSKLSLHPAPGRLGPSFVALPARRLPFNANFIHEVHEARSASGRRVWPGQSLGQL